MSDFDLLPFQKRFKRIAHSGKYNVMALSMPRGNGKSFIAASILDDLLHPDSPHFANGEEVVLLAADLRQARIVFNYLRNWREKEEIYRYQDSANKIGITLPASKGWWKTTKLVTYSSNGKGAMGIVGVPFVVADEPGAWEVNKGQIMADALFGALGKPGSSLRLLFIGTLAPSREGWWHDLVKGGTDEESRTFVHSLQGNYDKWDKWPTIQKANPLVRVSKEFRRQLLSERNKAKANSGLKARFISYRLNVPTADESEILITNDDWKNTLKRPVEDPEGVPVIGLDLGQGRSWSAAVAVWPNGRIEAFAVAPGIPDIATQEKRDQVPKGVYQKLVDEGCLQIVEGKRVQPIQDVIETIERRWPKAEVVICDRFRAEEVKDYASLFVEPRVTRWSEASQDIRSVRQWAKDGPMNIEKVSRKLMTASLMVSTVKSDDQGNTRLVKRGTNNTGRDDVSAAMLLAVGYAEREKVQSAARFLVG